MKRAACISAHACAVLWIALTLTSVLGACASGGKKSDASAASVHEKTGEPLRICYVDYVTGKRFELVNESHSDRSELYSKTKKLADAGTKVTTDEVMSEVSKLFHDQGYFERAVPGSAPPVANGGEGGAKAALEVEERGRTTHWSTPKTANDDYKRYNDLRKSFLYIYTNTYQLQSVDQAPDWDKQNEDARKSLSKQPLKKNT